MVGTWLRASDLPPPFVVDLPFQANQVTPIWLGHPETPQTTFATLNLPIQPPNPDASLLVTVYFQEKQAGFLRIVWQGPHAAQLLSDNFYEGIGMSNQRSLLIPAQAMTGTGKLSFQCGDANLGIQRIKLEWLESKTSLGPSQVQDLLVNSESGVTQPAQNLDGQPKAADLAAWRDKVVVVPITDSPERIEQGVEFSVQLDSVPISGRLALKVAGLPLGKHLVAWINQQRASTISPVVPDLLDAGYLNENPPDIYVGWRDGSFYVPVAFLKAGVNTVQFSSEDEAPSAPAASIDPSAISAAPIAVKNVVFQLNYAAPSANGATSAPQLQPNTPAMNALVPTGPVETTPSSSNSSDNGSLPPGPGEMGPSSSTPVENKIP